MIDKALYAIVGAVVGMLLLGILKPDRVFPDYDRIIVHEIRGEPDTVRTFVDRIVYRDRKPEVVVTQPGGGEDVVEDFCNPDTVMVVDTLEGDTIWISTDTVYLLRSIVHDPGWFVQRDRITTYGPTSASDLLEMRFTSWPGWSLRTHPELIFREPRLGWIKPIVEYGSVATLFYFLGTWIGGE